MLAYNLTDSLINVTNNQKKFWSNPLQLPLQLQFFFASLVGSNKKKKLRLHLVHFLGYSADHPKYLWIFFCLPVGEKRQWHLPASIDNKKICTWVKSVYNRQSKNLPGFCTLLLIFSKYFWSALKLMWIWNWELDFSGFSFYVLSYFSEWL